MKRILLILTATIALVAANFNTAKAQTLYVQVNGMALYASDGSDCNGGPDNRWRNSARSSSAGWVQWNVDVDEASGGWSGYTNGGWFASGGIPVTDNVQVSIDDCREVDGGICGGDDDICSGSVVVYDSPIATTIGACSGSGTLERFRGCADGSTWGVRFNWNYYVESASGGSILASNSTSSLTICNGTNAGTISNSVSPTLAGTLGYVSYQWEQSVGCTGTWTAIGGANSLTYSPGTPTQTTCYRRRTRYINNFSCGTFDVYSNTVTITVDQFTTANAGSDQTVCATSTTLAANTPTTGGGTWTVVNGTGTFSNANSPSSTVSNLSLGTNTFRWTVLNGVCTDSQDDVIITRDAFTTADAGADQTLCNSTSTTLSGNTPTSGTGTWTVVNGSGTFSPNANTPGATVSGLAAGINTFRWTLTNGACTDSQDDVIITRDVFTTADAGADQTLCGATSTNLAGNTPVTGVGTWTIVNGCAGCTFSNANSPTSALNNIPTGTSTLQWSLPNGSCTDSQDQVVIVNDAFTTANAGSDQTICDVTSTILGGNTPTTGAGTWSIISGCSGCTFSDANDPGATLSNIPAGTSTVRWTLPNGSCTDSQDDINITRDIYTAAAAGSQQNLCGASSTTLAANSPVTGQGTWSIVNGCSGCSFSNVNDPAATVSNLPTGTSTLRWTLPNGICGDSQSDVVIVNDAFTAANAGTDQTFCETTTINISGNTPTSGTGLWTIVNGCVGCSFGNASSPSTTLSNIPYGVNTIAWNLTNGNCTDDADQLVVTRYQTDNPSFSYSAGSYCANAGVNPVPTITGLTGGTFSANSGNLVIDTNTGEIDLVASVPGGPYDVTYQTNGNCPSSATFQVTILPADNSSFSYAQASFCQNGTNPLPNIISGGGTFVADAGLSINASTGEIDLAGSTVGGPYTITYTTPGPCPTSSTFQVSIIIADDPSFSYASASYCTNGTNPTPTVTGLTGGTFTASPGLFVNSTTGEISVATSLPGGPYVVTYTTNGTCPASAYFQVSIIAADNPAFAYGASSYCKNAGSNPSPVVSGLAGGTFTSSPAGLSIDGSTGEIDLVASAAGVYDITYTTNGPCVSTQTHQVTIIAADNSSFAYADATICINGSNPVPTITGLNGGTFTVSDNSIVINAATGEIDLSQSVVNVPFTVTYTTSGPCPTFSTQNLILLPAPVVSFSGLDADYCINEPTVTLAGSPAGGTFSGLGIIGNTFSPTLTVAGTHTITYTYTDGNNCTASTTQDVLINGLPFVSLSGLASSYCTSDNNAYPLTVSPAGGTLTGAGLSGTDFIPSTAGTGSVTITYSFTDANSCTNTATQSTVVNTLPVVGIAGLNAAYCIDAPSATLTGIPAGGTFSGTGISGNSFSPATAGVGTFTITYTYSDGNGCGNSTTQQVTVNDLPTVGIVNLGTDFCANDAPVNLIGNPPGGTFSGNGVSGSQLFPSIVGSGQTLITYNYTDGNSCSNSASQLVTIHALPVVSFSGLANQYCVSASPVTLTGSPVSGTFSGPGISGSTFDPAVAGVGTHTITFSYTDGNSCTNTSTQQVVVYALPTVAISNLAAQYCVDAPGVTLTGIPAGGTFSGVGMSGDIFTPSVAGAGNHTITYSYTDGNGCGNTTTQTVTVNPLPQPSITGLASAYCANAGSVAITGTPAGGTFSGTGVSGNTFNPSLAGAGTFTVTYTYTDGNSCTGVTTQQVTVNPQPVVNFTGLASQYCISETNAQTLTGSPAGGTFSGPGISGNDFTPSLAGVGTHTITYSYTDGNSCSASFSQQVTINNFPTVAITNLGSQYCVTAGVQTLSGTPSGGTFSGNGVTGNSFDPSAAGVGVHTITYSYSDQNGCSNTATQQVQVFAQPTVSIQGLGSAYCVNGTQVLFSGVPAGGTYSGPGVSGNTFNPSLAGVGTHTVTYNYSDGNGCANSTSQQVVVNATPVVSFSGLASSYCVSNSNAVTLTGAPAGGTFSGPGISGNDFTPSVAGNGTHTITYTYTDGNSCTGTTTQTVVINTLPTVAINNLATQYCVTTGAQAINGTPAGGTFSGPGIVGNSFNPSTAGVGIHTITYVYSDGNGCGNTATQQVQVYAQPTVTLSGLANTYCSNATPIAFTGSPANGTFGGPGVSGNTFYPNIAGPGTHTVTYSYTDGNGCGNTASQQVVVNAAPTPAITNLAPAYCASVTSVALTGTPGSGIWSGNGVTGNVFNPSAVTPGPVTITYTVTNGNNCTASATQQVVVNPLPNVGFAGLSSTYCTSSPAVTLTGFPAGGSFSGVGVVQPNSFDPAQATGTNIVTYTYTDANSCTNSYTQFVTVNQAPNVSFSGLAAQYCEGEAPVALTGAPAGGTFTGDGISGNTFNPMFAGLGTHTITYTYTAGNGCTGTSTHQVLINPAPIVNIVGLANQYCVNSALVNLTGVPSGGIFSGSPGVSNSQFNPATAVLGQNFVHYEYTDGNGCVGYTDAITVVAPLENASFYYSQQSFCQSGLTDPTPTITGATGGTFSAGAGLAITPNTGLIDVSASTVGSYTVTYTTAGACPGTYTFPVSITNGANAGFNYSSANFCNNSNNAVANITGDLGGQFTASPAGLSINNITGEVNLGASVVGCYTVTYAVGGSCPGSQTFNLCVNQSGNGEFSYPLYSYCQSSVNTPLPTITGDQGGTFANNDGLSVNPTTGAIDLMNSQQGAHTVTYTTTGACPATYSVNVFVTNGPVADITANGPTTFCFGGSVLLDAGSGYETYVWSNPANVNTQIVSVTTSGVYSVTVTDSSGCSSTDAVSVLVYQDPIAAFTYGTFSLQASFSNLSSNGQTYTWNFGDGSPLSNEPNPVHTYTDDGTYNVTLVVENICGSDSITIPLSVFKNGVNENVVGNFNLYPNPSDGNFKVTFDVTAKEDVAINVMDITGRVVYGESLSSYTGNFTKQYNFNTLDRGVYLFTVRTAKGVITKRIVLN